MGARVRVHPLIIGVIKVPADFLLPEEFLKDFREGTIEGRRERERARINKECKIEKEKKKRGRTRSGGEKGETEVTRDGLKYVTRGKIE